MRPIQPVKSLNFHLAPYENVRLRRIHLLVNETLKCFHNLLIYFSPKMQGRNAMSSQPRGSCPFWYSVGSASCCTNIAAKVFQRAVWCRVETLLRSQETRSFHSNQAAANERPEVRVARERRSVAAPHQATLWRTHISCCGSAPILSSVLVGMKLINDVWSR